LSFSLADNLPKNISKASKTVVAPIVKRAHYKIIDLRSIKLDGITGKRLE